MYSYDFTDEGENGDGLQVKCPAGSYPGNNGGDAGYIACVCDGKNPCKWMSEDFTGDITEDEICITDHSCPIA